jgi:5S rRNA maturation endonuclease (ribonuclease M5)
MGADDNTIQRLVIEAVRVKDTVAPETIPATDIATIDFKPRPLPPDSADFKQWATVLRLGGDWGEQGIDDIEIPIPLMTAVQYLLDRGCTDNKYNWYLSEDTAYNMHKRIIVPFYWGEKLIGYTARAIDGSVKPKYHNSHEPNFVFNINNQLPDSKFVIVCEGPFDAISVDGVAVLGNRVSEQQADIIDSLAREVIVVPDWDFDNKGKWTGKLLVDDALEYGWSVSFPVWRETCKDINDAVVKYGKLFVIKSILDSVEKSRLKIELIKKRIHTS